MTTSLDVPAALHLATAIPALMLGTYVIFSSKGTVAHKLAGRVWVALMISTALISFWVQRDGLSAIHLLSVLTLVSVISAFIAIKRGNMRIHRGNMIGAYLGIIGAAIGAVTPGRFLYEVLFG